MIPFAYENDLVFSEAFTSPESGSPSREIPRKVGDTPLIADKLRIPDLKDMIDRPRLRDLLDKASERFVANLISGRARTGKSMAAAQFARSYKKVAWLTLDTSDNIPDVFARYFRACVTEALGGKRSRRASAEEWSEAPEQISAFLSDLFSQVNSRITKSPMLIVLDDVHHIFDAPWFADFFHILLYSLNPSIHLLLLCRGKPPLPLWRLRSKQLLNVIDERVLAFDQAETEAVCKTVGCPPAKAIKVFGASFGRAGKVAEIARTQASVS